MSMNPENLAKQVEKTVKNPGPPPLDQWHPELSGDMDLRISRDGHWIFKGDPLAREAIVRLFSTILRREEDGEYYLLTPVEKWRIQVEDAPLLAHSLRVTGEGDRQVVSVTTNVGESLEIGQDHPLEVGTYPGSDEPRPIVKVRHGVEARLVTAAYYDLAEHVVERNQGGHPVLGVFSHGIFYKIGRSG
ncbi:DUF1285 domain-containing protein [Marinobacter subterrani]|uniref:DUF1285 domain-containing protein n=1 Tax=Marinobacter subterrani TaxID=1658765 RepID=A0A0J7J8E8_9GAMM|nr:DUF1285 domain-containing protein [Marinobacter subterrani]KMQ74467.1 hypothetical protein Msub_10651 [Marinobacter subterrani]